MGETANSQNSLGFSGDFRWVVKCPADLTVLRSLLIVAAPLFALATWQEDYSRYWVRNLSAPIVLCEAAIIILAFATRLDIVAAFRALHPLTRWAAVCWLAISAFASLTVAGPGQNAGFLFAISTIHAVFGFAVWWKLKTNWSGYAAHMLAAAAMGVVIYGAILFILSLSVIDPAFNWKHFGPGVSNGRQLAFYGITASGIGGGFLVFAKHRAETAFWFCVLVMGCWLTVWAGGRAGFASMIGAFVVITLLKGGLDRLRFAAMGSLALLVGIGLSQAFIPSERYGIETIFDRTVSGFAVEQDGSVSAEDCVFECDNESATGFTTGRAEMWEETVEHIGDHPLFGHGEGQFRTVVRNAYGQFNHPHNVVLQFVFQWGLVGTVAFLAMLLPTIRSFIKSKRPYPKTVIVAAGPLLGLAAMSLLEGSAYHVFPAMMMVMCLAIIVAQLDNPAIAASGQKS